LARPIGEGDGGGTRRAGRPPPPPRPAQKPLGFPGGWDSAARPGRDPRAARLPGPPGVWVFWGHPPEVEAGYVFVS